MPRTTRERDEMRRRKYRVTPELLLQLFTTGNANSVLQGIPPGARVVATINDYSYGPETLYVVVQHHSFDECRPGESAPEHEILMESRADFESMAQCTYEFTAVDEDSTPVYVCTVPSNFSMDRISTLREIFDSAQIHGRVLVLPADVTLDRVS